MLTFLAEAAERWRQGPYVDLVGQSRVVPYLFPTPAMTAGLPTRPAVAIHAEAGTYAYDTMTLVGDRHLGGRPRGGRLRPDRGRPGAGGRACGVRAVPAARPPRDAGRLRRLVLPQQRRGRGRGAARRWARPGGGDRHRRAPGQRHGRDLLRPRGRALRVGPRRPRCRVVPAHRGLRRRDGHRRRRRVHPQPAAAGGDRRRRPGWRRSETWPTGWSPRAARPWWSPWASTPPPTTPRARSWSPSTATGRPGRSLGATGLPAVVVQEGGYHLPTLGSLVAAYLDGHAAGDVSAT